MRKKIAICLGLVLLGIPGVFLWLRRDAPRITEEQVEMIQVGMSLNEVEAILGCPPGNYTYSDPVYWHSGPLYDATEWVANKPGPRYAHDDGSVCHDAIAVRVRFDEQGKVIDKLSTSYPHRPPSFWDRVRKLLK